METHPICLNDKNAYHLVCLNIPFGLEFPKESDADTWIQAVRKAGGETIFAHPY